MTDIKTLNVTEIPPRIRHAQIFETFDALESGEAFILVNDHEPRPLYLQFLHDRPEIFTWEYLEEGPEVWRVKIGRS
jgi:uncharacterized protein (DUF2249 family)